MQGPDSSANLHDLSDQTIGHYKVLHELDRGGMGVVYKAEDTRLRRTIALKFLPRLLHHDPQARQRFMTEAQAASALDHPNICTIHDIGQTDEGLLYIAMAFYEGETLKQKIGRGALPVSEAVDYAMQVARGLSRAHTQGIIHRDIKPANVMITVPVPADTGHGVVKILDFGLAKMADSDLTQPGLMLGTASYMSPEQTRSEKVDARTDIWSLGLVLYEMLAGACPFRGGNPSVTLYWIATKEPAALRSLRSDIPPALDDVVRHALAKDREDRFATAQDLHLELQRVQRSLDSQASLPPPHIFKTVEPPVVSRSVVTSSGKLAIAVLPFEDLSPGKDNEYFSDGLTEEIIIDLSQIERLSVISRTSAMMFKGSDKTVKTIGQELDVRYVLEGSVRKAGNNLRITAQLIDARDGANVWADRYRGTLDDIFDIQETVSRSIADALKLQLSPEEEQRLAEHPIDNVHAYECYLRARQEILRWTEDALDRALQHLENGLAIVGENALLYAGLGQVYWQYVNAGIKPPEYLDKAEAYADRVFELDPDSQHGHRLYGLIAILRGQVQEAVRHLKQTLTLDPNDPDALLWLSIYYGYLGRTEAGYPLIERLLKIDPLTPLNHGVPGWLHFLDGQFDRSVASYRAMYGMEPGNPVYGFFYAHGLAYTDARDDACAVIEEVEKAAPDNPFTWMCVFLKHALQGDPDAAHKAVTPALKAVAEGDMQYSWFMAICYALLDEKEDGLDWLTNATQRGFIHYPFLAKTDPFLENLRGEERFHELMETVKHEWKHLDV